MKAALVNGGSGLFCVEEIEIDNPRGREVLIEVKASGLCHTDLNLAELYRGQDMLGVLGHELAGVVKEIGPEVSEFAVGDHVVGSLIRCCGECPRCLEGRTYICERPETSQRAPDEPPRLSLKGAPVNQFFGTGGFAEMALVHENQLAKVPPQVPFAQASLLGCGCMTGAGAAMNTAKVSPGQCVAVFGVGGVGLSVVGGARIAGATTIVAVDLVPEKAELARKFGATHFVDARESDPVKAVQAIVAGGVDHAFDVVGLPITTRQAVDVTRPGGGVYLIGMNRPGEEVTIDVARDMLGPNRTIHGVMMGSCNTKRDVPLLAELYLQGKFNLDDLVSREIRLSEINEAYAEMQTGKIARSVITSF